MVEIFEVKAPENKCFYCETGQVLHSINDLKVGLAFCKLNHNKEIFDKHVHDYKNDFSNWIRDVFGYKDLADKIYNAREPEEMLKIINNYEQQYNLNLINDKNKINQSISKIESEVELKKEIKLDSNSNSVSNESLKDEIEQRFERADKEFDRVKKIKQRSLYDKANYAESVEDLKTKYEELQSMISEMRKEGKDVSIPSMLLGNLRPKITYFQVSQNQNDYNKVIESFDEIQKELEYANKPKKKSLREEILEKANIFGKKEER